MTAPYTLLYVTSAWVASVDELLLPMLRALLDQINALNAQHQLIALREVYGPHERNCSTDSNSQRLEAASFRSLCIQFHVTDVPACVLLDANGQALTPKGLQCLEDQLCQIHDEDVASRASSDATSSCSWQWKMLRELLNNNNAPAAAWNTLRPLWQANVTALRFVSSKVLEVNDVALVEMREEALGLFETGQLVPAASRFVNVLVRCPTCTKSSFNLAVILDTIGTCKAFEGETYFAVSNMLRVVALDDSDSVAHTVLRSVYYPKEPDLVVAGYHLITSANRSSHVRTAHSLATLEGGTATRTAAPAYVAEVFDELADSFEEKLVAHLEYRVPWQLVEALQIQSPPGFVSKDSMDEPTWVVADVGCGTGLCGRLLRPHVNYIIGVDISPLMIEKTRAKGSYDELYTTDIVPFLESCANESLDLVISADVWIYVGALEQVFELCARKLRASTGWMAFSIEVLDSKATEIVVDSAIEFRLAPSGRFQHSPEYIMSLAARSGFTIVLQEDISVRKESNEPIPGRIYLLQRAMAEWLIK